jgi:hypothetical protein
MRKVVWQWDDTWKNPNAKMWMGVQKNENGTGFKKLEDGDEPLYCEYCKTITEAYPHSHTKEDKDKHAKRP